jgi:hypothetical protein
MKCETPARASVSSRDPVPIQNPNETERTLGTCSLITRSPVERLESSYSGTEAIVQPLHHATSVADQPPVLV